MKFKRKPFIIILVIILLLVITTACNGKVSYKVAYEESFNAADIPFDVNSFFENEIMLDVAEKIDSLGQLKEFLNKFNLQVYAEDSGKYDSKLYKKFRNYGKKFFVNKALVVAFTFKTSFECIEFESIDIQNIDLVINLKNKSNANDLSGTSSDSAAVMTAYVYLIEIDKTLVKDINNIIVKEN